MRFTKAERTLRGWLVITIACAVVALLLLGAIFYFAFKSDSKKESSGTPATAAKEVAVEPPKPANSGALKSFSPVQFVALYKGTAFPNTQPILSAPTITGNAAADKRIQILAEEAGYKLGDIPVTPILKLDLDGLQGDDLLQPKAYYAWLTLKEMAGNEKVALQLVSAYRSPEYQRGVFMWQLKTNSVTAETIAAGGADAQIKKILVSTAPPGYSRHHAGYAVDLGCEGSAQAAFVSSPCFKWLSATNYAKAKQAGWVPTYPLGSAQSVPEQEPFEFIWVGTDALTQ